LVVAFKLEKEDWFHQIQIDHTLVTSSNHAGKYSLVSVHSFHAAATTSIHFSVASLTMACSKSLVSSLQRLKLMIST
jgi:hypothetical protein